MLQGSDGNTCSEAKFACPIKAEPFGFGATFASVRRKEAFAKGVFMTGAMLINLILQIVGGVIGGNGIAGAVKNASLGSTGNTIAGAIGGLAGGGLLSALIPALAGGTGGFDIAAAVGQLVGGGVSGAVVTAIVGMIINATKTKA